MKISKKTTIYIAVSLGLLVAIAMVWILASRPVSSKKEPVNITVAKGQTAGQVAVTLKKAHAIRSATVFRIICKLSGDGSKLKPGAYVVSRSMNVRQIIRHLVSGKTVENWLTIPEGYTIRQIADELEAKQIAKGDDFVNAALNDGSQFRQSDFIFGDNLEGYLFPDTYLFQPNIGSKTVIEAMLSAFQSKVVDKHRADVVKVGLERFGLKEESFYESLYKVLIMASLVEREARVAKDRPVIAAVLWNRLDKKIRLEICATVSYVPGVSRGNKEKVYIADTKADTPYNTYRIYGLPPTPICNPGSASIEAVLNPAQVDYLYYVAKSDGSHIFSRTYSEHLAAKRQVSGK